VFGGKDVAARSAAAVLRPALTSSANSSCRLAPNAGWYGTPGVALASVPARIGTPAACSTPTPRADAA
jgi:hypothetical protein